MDSPGLALPGMAAACAPLQGAASLPPPTPACGEIAPLPWLPDAAQVGSSTSAQNFTKFAGVWGFLVAAIAFYDGARRFHAPAFVRVETGLWR